MDCMCKMAVSHANPFQADRNFTHTHTSPILSHFLEACPYGSRIAIKMKAQQCLSAPDSCLPSQIAQSHPPLHHQLYISATSQQGN